MKRFPSLAAALAGWLGIPFASAEAAPLDSNQQTFFETKIRPVLAEQCYECHNAQKHKGGLALDSRVAWEQGGDSGPVVIRGKAEESRLIKALRHTDPELKMPRNAPKLDERVISDPEVLQLDRRDVAICHAYRSAGVPEMHRSLPPKAITPSFPHSIASKSATVRWRNPPGVPSSSA